MSKTNTFETDFLELIFNNTDIANIGDAAGIQNSATAGSLYIALYTSAPGEAGGGTEATYGAYARQAVARSGAGWTVSGNQAENAAIISFPECTSGSETVTDFAILTASSGGDMLFYGSLDTSRAVSTGVTVEFAIGALTITED